MCGIAGQLSYGGPSTADQLVDRATSMIRALRHRGPDDSGFWVDPVYGIALGHSRLSIVDLSPAGHQPMLSATARYIIIFNGEIYNFTQIRSQMEPRLFRGHSDTEVMLAAIEHWGLDSALARFNGMFAFALWDKDRRQLHLCRDRLGEKPLYYGWVKGAFVFASELKSIRTHPGWNNEINRDTLAAFLRYGYIPAPHSIYSHIYQLPPASHLIVTATDGKPELALKEYWSAREVAEQGSRRESAAPEPELLDRAHGLLRDAVQLRMVADVPVGAFLSGGIDSSLIVALMQEQSTEPIRTFTIGFHQHHYNEAPYAKMVAEHLGTAHSELYVTSKEALDVIPRLPCLYDEPFADPSQIPTFLVSRLARQQVTVSLSGDGGDELFGGYHRYRLASLIWQYLKPLPAAARRQLSLGVLALLRPLGMTGTASKPTAAPRINKLLDRCTKLAQLIGVPDEQALYRRHMSQWSAPTHVVLNATEPVTPLTDSHLWETVDKYLYKMMYCDLVSYLPDDILVKVDRAAMAVSLESRIPLLDHRVVEFSWELPYSMKMRAGKGKWLLRQLLKKYLPEKLVERPKMGFGVPIDDWLRGPLKGWADDLLEERKLRQQGYLSPGPICLKWAQHKVGVRNWAGPLWNVLMFQAWLERVRG